MKNYLVALFIALSVSNTSAASRGYVLKDSVTTYVVTHPAHKVTASSKESRGKTQCSDNGDCEYLVAVPIKSFDSDSGGRDQHMLEITRASMNPMVQLKGRIKDPASGAFEGKMEVEISFAGETKKFSALPVEMKKEGNGWHAKGSWTFKLSDFKIERPKLLLVPVQDDFQIEFDQSWSVQDADASLKK